MKTRTFPSFTFSLLALVLALHALPGSMTVLNFGASEILGGQAWRLLTGHLVHADLNHLFWNALGLLVLGVLIERHSRRWLGLAMAAGTLAVNLLLLVSGLDYYCGLSGVLNTLLVIALWLEWRSSRSWWVIAVALGCIVKVAIEIGTGDSLVSHISWPPYAWSHLAGMLGGAVVVFLGECHLKPRKEFAF
ncbi:MAG: rhombosortase [Xanthomonadales bacterium]|nr:rhombosortase [Xanthomonadales bacterium]